jgi:hypothetical protein
MGVPVARKVVQSRIPFASVQAKAKYVFTVVMCSPCWSDATRIFPNRG